MEWLATMQHYGAPTRLLDISFNPMIALYFAMEAWTLSPAQIYVHAFHLETIRAESRRRGFPPNAQITPGNEPQGQDYVLIYEGRIPSDRHIAQQGGFLVPSRIDLDFGEWLASFPPRTSPKPYKCHWVKYKFPTDAKRLRQMVKELMNMGLGPQVLFPGIEGVARSVHYTLLDVAKGYE